eukprot:gene42897-57042_t
MQARRIVVRVIFGMCVALVMGLMPLKATALTTIIGNTAIDSAVISSFGADPATPTFGQ